jgi:hypothetical protein
MSYEEIRIPQELSESVQQTVGIAPRRHGTLGELVKDVAVQRGVLRPENLISEQQTRHEVRVNGEILYTYKDIAGCHHRPLTRGRVRSRPRVGIRWT